MQQIELNGCDTKDMPDRNYAKICEIVDWINNLYTKIEVSEGKFTVKQYPDIAGTLVDPFETIDWGHADDVDIERACKENWAKICEYARDKGWS